MKVNNILENSKRYVVARYCDDQLWYWGSWDNEERALSAADEIGGVVVDTYGEK